MLLHLPLPSPSPPILLEDRSSSLLTPLAHVSATWSFFICIQSFVFGTLNRYSNGQQDFAFVSSQGVGLRSALRFPVFEFEIGEGVEQRTVERTCAESQWPKSKRERKMARNKWQSVTRGSPVLSELSHVWHARISKDPRPVIYANIYILVKKT